MALLDLCYERPNPDSEAPIHPLQEQQQKVFEDELAEYSYFIPPNFLDLGIKVLKYFNFYFILLDFSQKFTKRHKEQIENILWH